MAKDDREEAGSRVKMKIYGAEIEGIVIDDFQPISERVHAELFAEAGMVEDRWRVSGWSPEDEMPAIHFVMESRSGFVLRADRALPILNPSHYICTLREFDPNEDAEEPTGEMLKLLQESCEECEASGLVTKGEEWKWPRGTPMPTRWRTYAEAPAAIQDLINRYESRWIPHGLAIDVAEGNVAMSGTGTPVARRKGAPKVIHATNAKMKIESVVAHWHGKPF